MQRAARLLINAIIKDAELRKSANRFKVLLDAFAKQIQSRLLQSLSRPEQLTAAVAFTDQNEDAVDILNTAKTLWQLRSELSSEPQSTRDDNRSSNFVKETAASPTQTKSPLRTG